MNAWVMLFAGTAAVAFGLLMLLQRSLYGSAVCFLGVILQAAVLLYGSGAKLLAFLLILIYAGAVAVLVVVSIHSSSGAPEGGAWSLASLPRSLILAGFLLPAMELVGLLLLGWPLSVHAGSEAGDLLLGRALFGPYAVASEAAAFLMLLAALAVVMPEDSGA